MLSDLRAVTLTLCSVSHFAPSVAAVGCVLWQCHPMAPWGPFGGSRRVEPCTAMGGTSPRSLCPSMQHGTEHTQEVRKLPANEQGQQLLVLQM